MALKNKDGTLFKATTQNPLMKIQNWINSDDLEFHNFIWEAMTILGEESEDVHVETTVDISSNAADSVLPKTKPQIQKFQNSITVNCLPVIWNNREDNLYGDSYKTKTYGQKFIFEAMVIERGDLAISLWTASILISSQGKVSIEDYIKPGSIIFPSFGDYRWWEIKELQPYKEGILIVAVATDFQPSF
jgi:hypothetical protein